MQKDSIFTLAQQSLLQPFALNERKLEQVFGTMLAHQLDYADLYFQYGRSESWALEEGIVKSGSFSIDQGVGIRAVSGEKTAFAYSDDISLAALDSAALATRAIARQGGNQSVSMLSQQTGKGKKQGKGKKSGVLSPENGLQLYLPHDPIASLGAAEKVNLLERLERCARAIDPRVTQVMASLAGEYEIVLVARSDGLMNADIRPLVRLSLQVIVESNGKREQGSAGGGGRFDYAYFNDEVIQKYAAEAVHQAVTNLDARPAPAGNMTVILGSGWPGFCSTRPLGTVWRGILTAKKAPLFQGVSVSELPPRA